MMLLDFYFICGISNLGYLTVKVLVSKLAWHFEITLTQQKYEEKRMLDTKNDILIGMPNIFFLSFSPYFGLLIILN